MSRAERGDAVRLCLAAAFSVGAALLAVMLFTGYFPGRPNEYNSYALQASAWLEGHLDILGSYPHLELALFGDRQYVSFPPFPSYVLLPFAAVWGTQTPDAAISLAVTALGAAYACRLYLRERQDGQGLFWVLFLYLGTGYVFIAMNGYVWFLAQTMCFTLSVMSLFYAREGKGCPALTLWACAVGCRPMTALYLPVLLYLLWGSRPAGTDLPGLIRRRWYWCVGPLVLAASYMALNMARFGSPLEFGHTFLPEFQRAEHGQFSLAYFSDNLNKLLRMPRWQGSSEPVMFYTGNGMAFWLIDPMFFPLAAAWIMALWKRREDLFLLIALPVLSAAYVFVLCCHRTLGGWYFGNRYLLDLMPWLFYGFCRWKPEEPRFLQASVPFAVFGAALNLIGSVAVYNYWI